MSRKAIASMTLLIVILAFGQDNYKGGGVRLSPRLLNYQGYLTDTLSNPINGSYDILFRLYDDSLSGTLLWSENQLSVPIAKGIFHVLLGNFTQLPDSVFTKGVNRWLSLRINSQDLTPRTRIVSSPYSITSTISDTALYAKNSAPDNDWTRLFGKVYTYNLTDSVGIRTVTPRYPLDVNGVICGGSEDTVKATYGGILSGYGNLAGDAEADSGATVCGGIDNDCISKHAYIGGGYDNNIDGGGLAATIGGGRGNFATGSAATVAGGAYNFGNGAWATVAGGGENSAVNCATVAGGYGNTADGSWSAVGGGSYNEARASYSTVAGGRQVLVKALYGGALSGWANQAGDSLLDTAAVVTGGLSNVVSAPYGCIGGGRQNNASGAYSSILGGFANTISATGDYSYLFGINSNLTQDSTFMVDLPHVWLGTQANGYEFPRNRGTNGQVMVTNGTGQLSWASAPPDNDWTYRVTDGADTTLQTVGRWGLARQGNFLYGNADSTHVNFGVACSTGATGFNYKYTAVGGGFSNIAANTYATVPGGQNNYAYGYGATVGGGTFNISYSNYSSVGGGAGNRAYNVAVVSGGNNNQAVGDFSFIGGGYVNNVTGPYAAMAGGRNNLVPAACGGIFSGYYNRAGVIADDSGAVVAGGVGNTAVHKYDFVGGGYSDTAAATYSAVVGGYGNFAGNDYTFVGGGYYNKASGLYSSIAGGSNNYTAGDYSAILGGFADTISTTGDYSYLFGINSNLTQDSTFMVDLPHVWFGTEANGYQFPVSRGSNGQVMVTNGSGILSWGGITYVDSSRISTNSHKLQGKDTTSLDARWVNEGQAAGGDLTGTYPNPTIANNAVNSDKIQDGSIVSTDIRDTTITAAKIKDGAVTMAKINQSGATTGQVIKWNGSAWQPASDSFRDNDWTFLISDGADTALQMGGRWGLTRLGNGLRGNADSTHVNLGVACTTGTVGQNYKYCVIGGGYKNTALNSYSTISGGNENVTTSQYSTIGGGYSSTLNGLAATIGGGSSHSADGSYTTVGGGYNNSASEYASNVAGGYQNKAYAVFSGVGAGFDNQTGGPGADTGMVIAGGYSNSAQGNYSFIGGGKDNLAWNYAAISGGDSNYVYGIFSFIGGGHRNLSGNTPNNSDTAATVGGGWLNVARADFSTVGGGYSNSSDTNYATISGGYNNTASGQYSTIGGGATNTASNEYATVGGGSGDTASGYYSVVAGGQHNVASDYWSAVGGGGQNYAGQRYATVAGGYRDTVTDYYSFATNYHTKVAYQSSAAFTTSHATADNQVRAAAFSTGTLDIAMDYPDDPMNKILNQYGVASDEVMLIYSGSVVLDASGRAKAVLPDYFDDIARNPRIQLTGVGSAEVVYVAEDVHGNSFVVGGKPGMKVYWTVNAERKDIHAEIARIKTPVVQEKTNGLENHSIDDDAMIGIYDDLRQKNPELFRFKTAEGRQADEQAKTP